MSERGGLRWPTRRVYRRPELLSTVVVGVVSLLVAAVYLALGCGRDWALLGGLLLDLVGAAVLALPDLPRVSDRLHAGRLRAARRGLARSTSRDGARESTIDYPAFREAVLEPLASELAPERFDPAEGLPEGAVFEVVRLGRGERVEIYDGIGSDTIYGSVPYPVVAEKLQREIDRYEGRIRRSGLSLLLVGFSVQILAVLQESNLFGICG